MAPTKGIDDTRSPWAAFKLILPWMIYTNSKPVVMHVQVNKWTNN